MIKEFVSVIKVEKHPLIYFDRKFAFTYAIALY